MLTEVTLLREFSDRLVYYFHNVCLLGATRVLTLHTRKEEAAPSDSAGSWATGNSLPLPRAHFDRHPPAAAAAFTHSQRENKSAHGTRTTHAHTHIQKKSRPHRVQPCPGASSWPLPAARSPPWLPRPAPWPPTPASLPASSSTTSAAGTASSSTRLTKDPLAPFSRSRRTR